MAVDTVLVGSIGADGRKALEVAVVTDRQRYGAIEDALAHVIKGCSDTPHDFIVVAAFILLIVCAVFVGVAGGEIEPHVFAPLTGQEERFGRMWGWI